MIQTFAHRRLIGIVLVLAGIAALMLSYTAPGSAQGNAYDITLYGENEVPPVFTDATGSATVQVLPGEVQFSVAATGASFTMGHFHVGAAGTNGPVVAWLLDATASPVSTVSVSGTITEADLVGPFEGDWDGFLQALTTGNLYINLHSEANPAGELRAQVYPRWGATLSPGEENHDVESDASGSYLMDVTSASASYSLTGGGGTEAFTMGHIHVAPAGSDGPIVVWLLSAMDDPLAEFSVSDTFSAVDLEGDFEGDWNAFLDALVAGDLYVNVHSEEFPAGEMRGQLSHTSNFDADPADVTEPTPTPTEVPTEVPTATPTDVPPATATAPAPTATPTLVAPGPPATGTGDGGSDGTMMLIGLGGLAAIVIGGALVFSVRRKLS